MARSPSRRPRGRRVGPTRRAGPEAPILLGPGPIRARKAWARSRLVRGSSAMARAIRARSEPPGVARTRPGSWPGGSDTRRCPGSRSRPPARARPSPRESARTPGFCLEHPPLVAGLAPNGSEPGVVRIPEAIGESSSHFRKARQGPGVAGEDLRPVVAERRSPAAVRRQVLLRASDPAAKRNSDLVHVAEQPESLRAGSSIVRAGCDGPRSRRRGPGTARAASIEFRLDAHVSALGPDQAEPERSGGRPPGGRGRRPGPRTSAVSRAFAVGDGGLGGGGRPDRRDASVIRRDLRRTGRGRWRSPRDSERVPCLLRGGPRRSIVDGPASSSSRSADIARPTAEPATTATRTARRHDLRTDRRARTRIGSRVHFSGASSATAWRSAASSFASG